MVAVYNMVNSGGLVVKHPALTMNLFSNLHLHIFTIYILYINNYSFVQIGGPMYVDVLYFVIIVYMSCYYICGPIFT